MDAAVKVAGYVPMVTGCIAPEFIGEPTSALFDIKKSPVNATESSVAPEIPPVRLAHTLALTCLTVLTCVASAQIIAPLALVV